MVVMLGHKGYSSYRTVRPLSSLGAYICRLVQGTTMLLVMLRLWHPSTAGHAALGAQVFHRPEQAVTNLQHSCST